MQNLDVDVAILGTGTAGLSAYRAAVAQGKRALLIESGPYGTTCARVGCMPSKLLIAAADAAHMLDLAPGFGVHAGERRIDGKAVMARVQRERDRFVGFVLDSVNGIPEQDRLRGHARFTGPRTLQVDEHTTVKATRFVIATGSTPVKLPVLDGAGAAVITSDDIFELPDLPESMAVIGTGVIGLELGQAMARLGVRVSFFARGGSVGQITDPEVLHVATRTFSSVLDIRFQQRIVRADQRADGHVDLCTRDAMGAERTDTFQYILVAAGRTPNVARIGLEHTGLMLDHAGIPLYDRCTMQCGDSHIFIAGDADDERPLLSEAADQGRIAGDNAGRFPDVRPGLRRTALTIAFTEPQIATAGESYRTLAAGKSKFALGVVSFENQGRSRVMLQNHGLLRVYGEYGSGRFLGAEMVGPRAEHLGHLLAWACQARMTVDQMLEMPFYHPVIEEGLRTALRDLHVELAKGAPDIAAASVAAGV